jgi:VWFA-related protein
VFACAQQNGVSWGYPAAGNLSSGFVSAPSTDNASAADDQSVITTLRSRVDEVSLVFTATDKHGHFVRNLSEKDFAILDDHQPPQSILQFHPETDLPLAMGLLVDVSGSVHSRFAFEQQSAIDFLQHSVRRGYDKAFVIGFNTRSQTVQDFTDDTTLLASGIMRLHSGGGTALYDAIYQACHDKLLREKGVRPIRKALIILSDGEDNQSEYTRGQAIEMAQRAEVMLYAISTDDSGLIMRGDRNLELLASATGGRAFFPYKMKDVSRSFAEIEEELRSQYSISYKPANFVADGRYRPIEISAPHRDLQVRTRQGYFAPKQ